VGSSFYNGDTLAHSHSLPSITGIRHSLHSPVLRSLLAARLSARIGAANSRYFTGPDGRRTWRPVPGFGLCAAGSGSKSPPLTVTGLLPVTTGSQHARRPLHGTTAPATLAHNSSFKPKPLRGSA